MIVRWKKAVMTKSDESFADLMVLCSRYSDYINVDLTGFGYRPIQLGSATRPSTMHRHITTTKL
jgi:hypothetical protein